MKRRSYTLHHIHVLLFPQSVVNPGVKMLIGRFQKCVILRDNHAHIAPITTHRCTSLYSRLVMFALSGALLHFASAMFSKGHILSSLGLQLCYWEVMGGLMGGASVI